MTEYKKTANTSKPAIINLNNYVGSTIPRNLTEKTFCNDNLKKRFRYKNQKEIKGQQKNFIFVWPPKQTPFYYKKEVIWAMWAIAHMVYWLNVVCLFPSGQGSYLKIFKIV